MTSIARSLQALVRKSMVFIFLVLSVALWARGFQQNPPPKKQTTPSQPPPKPVPPARQPSPPPAPPPQRPAPAPVQRPAPPGPVQRPVPLAPSRPMPQSSPVGQPSAPQASPTKPVQNTQGRQPSTQPNPGSGTAGANSGTAGPNKPGGIAGAPQSGTGIAGPNSGTAGSNKRGGITGAPQSPTQGPGASHGTSRADIPGVTPKAAPLSNPGMKAPVYAPQPGIRTTVAADGTRSHFNPATRTVVSTDSGGHVTGIVHAGERPGLGWKANGIRSDQTVARIDQQRNDGSRMIIERNIRGERRVEIMQPGGVRIVAAGQHSFVEQPLRGGLVSRTYVVGERTEVQVYRPTVYSGAVYYTYVPTVSYQPAFVTWVRQPWARPASYMWEPSPWSGFYSAYFSPEPAYPNASAWLSDYVVGENLRNAYNNRPEEEADNTPDVTPHDRASEGRITPEVKQALVQQVATNVSLLQPAKDPVMASPEGSAVPMVLTSRQKIFVVSSILDLERSDNEENCSLTPGDIIERTADALDKNDRVAVVVRSSKDGDCPVNMATTLDIRTLQDMLNEFLVQLGTGLQKLSASEGKSGIPNGPPANPKLLAQVAPAPDARELLSGGTKEADRTEAEVKASLGPSKP